MTPFTQIMTPFIIIVTILLSIFAWEMLRSIYRKWFKEEPIKHYQPERHVYPKKDDNIPEMDKIAIEKNDKEYELAGGCLVKKDCECDCSGKWKTEPEIYFHDGCQGHVPLTHYMSKGNVRYFRGENVRVAATVKGGGYEKIQH